MRKIDELIESRSILVCCGVGGVGKTTVSSAIGIRAAQQGKKVIVITVDPSKRLRSAMGIEDQDTELFDLTEKLFKGTVKGSISAVIPNTQRTFDDLLKSFSAGKNFYEKMTKNPIFEMISKEFSGSNDYMAIQKLESIHETGQYDLIILDTPPSRNAVQFLDAPNLLAKFYEEKWIRWLVMPANRLVSVGMRTAIGWLEKLTGKTFMSHLVEFASGLLDVQAEYFSRLKEIESLLRNEKSGFLYVSAPNPDIMAELNNFVSELSMRDLNFEGYIINRTLSPLQPTQENSPTSTETDGLKVLDYLIEKERESLKQIDEISTKQGKISIRIPELSRDIQSLEDLHAIAAAIS